MNITITVHEAEIKELILAHITNSGIDTDGKEVKINFIAGRKGNGISSEVLILETNIKDASNTGYKEVNVVDLSAATETPTDALSDTPTDLLTEVANEEIEEEEKFLSEESKKEIDEAVAEAEKELKEEEEKAQAAAEAELEEEDKLIPSGPITLKGSVWESALTLIIDLQTGEVGGSIYFSDGEDTYNLTIDGNIDLETYKIDGNCSGIWVSQALGTSETITVTIEGQLNEDFSGASGTSTGNAGTDNWTAN